MNIVSPFIEQLLNSQGARTPEITPELLPIEDPIAYLYAEIDRACQRLEEAIDRVKSWKADLVRAEREGAIDRAQVASHWRNLMTVMRNCPALVSVSESELKVKALDAALLGLALRPARADGDDRPLPEKSQSVPSRRDANVLLPSSVPQSKDLTRRTCWQNSLGMKFVPVPGTEVLCCLWPTRVMDYAAYSKANPRNIDNSWEKVTCDSVPVSNGPDHPVTMVSWQDAKAFCEWLTNRELKEGRLSGWQHYRLLMDTEWSTVAGLTKELGDCPRERNGNERTSYPWGRQWPPPVGAGNYADASAAALMRMSEIPGYRDGFATTSPVGSFSVNQFGLYDLGGNVWEWCEDWLDYECKHKVWRGASWMEHHPCDLLTSRRNCDNPSARHFHVGFRIALAGIATTSPVGTDHT